jgi:hypothetical protein
MNSQYQHEVLFKGIVEKPKYAIGDQDAVWFDTYPHKDYPNEITTYTVSKPKWVDMIENIEPGETIIIGQGGDYWIHPERVTGLSVPALEPRTLLARIATLEREVAALKNA